MATCQYSPKPVLAETPNPYEHLNNMLKRNLSHSDLVVEAV
jgi:hypothetical protein